MIEFGEVDTLIDLLEKTQRKAIINGKLMPQVKSCVIHFSDDGIAETTMIVRDGKTSVATFRAECEKHKAGSVVIPDIETALGVLKMFPRKRPIGVIKVDSGLRFKSTGKQTTITADERALAFPHTQKTVREWCIDSKVKMGCMTDSVGYKMRDGNVRLPMFSCAVYGSRVKDALKMSSMNGQKTARFTLRNDSEGVHIEVGSSLQGRTVSDVDCEVFKDVYGEWVFEGGLENVLEDGEIRLQIIDFTPENQGYIMLIRSPSQEIMLRSVFTA